LIRGADPTRILNRSRQIKRFELPSDGVAAGLEAVTEFPREYLC
jgi:hypothetical protein